MIRYIQWASAACFMGLIFWVSMQYQAVNNYSINAMANLLPVDERSRADGTDITDILKNNKTDDQKELKRISDELNNLKRHFKEI